jgi:hypothetical protein
VALGWTNGMDQASPGGGVLMSLADTAGALVAFLGLAEGATTATITSTTQMFRPGQGRRSARGGNAVAPRSLGCCGPASGAMSSIRALGLITRGPFGHGRQFVHEP